MTRRAPGHRKGISGVPTEPVLYEAMYILDTAMEEDQVAEVVSAFEVAVAECGGRVTNSLPFGRRRLSYEIKGHAEGLYMITYFETERQDAVQLLTRELGLIEPIIRFVICVSNPAAVFTGRPAPAPAEDVTAEAETATVDLEAAADEDAPTAEAAADDQPNDAIADDEPSEVIADDAEDTSDAASEAEEPADDAVAAADGVEADADEAKADEEQN